MDQEVYSVAAARSPNSNNKAVVYSVAAAHSPNSNNNSLLAACYSANKVNRANKAWAQPRRPNSGLAVVAGAFLATLGNKGNSKLPMALSPPSKLLY